MWGDLGVAVEVGREEPLAELGGAGWRPHPCSGLVTAVETWGWGGGCRLRPQNNDGFEL